jgi:hypothetical protein
MEEKYWIYQDNWIFKPDFNESMDKYIGIIKQSNCIGLIFSNYSSPEICAQTNNKYKYEYYKNYKMSLFNKPLVNSLGIYMDNLSQLRHLTFGKNFNHHLTNSLDNLTNLTHLTFGECFNQPLTNSLGNLINLTHLTFGHYFNQPLTNSLGNLINLTHLTFGWEFNQPLTNSLGNLINL